MSLLDRALRMGEAKKFKTYEQRVSRITGYEAELEHSTDAELREAADELRERARGGERSTICCTSAAIRAAGDGAAMFVYFVAYVFPGGRATVTARSAWASLRPLLRGLEAEVR